MITMILNAAPMLATLYATKASGPKTGAMIAFAGIILTLAIPGSGTFGISFNLPVVLVGTAALSYTASILWLGYMRQCGETATNINFVYNLGGFGVILILLTINGWSKPAHIPSLILVASMSAVRLQLHTIASRSKEISANVSVLSNLTFVWIAFYEALSGGDHPLSYWTGVVLVIIGTWGTQLKTKSTECKKAT